MSERTARFKAVLDAIEQETRFLSSERITVLDLEGNLLLSRSGAYDHVDLEDVPAATFEGCVVTHNHPQGKSFSVQDVRFLIVSKVVEIRAVTRQYRFSLAVPSDSTWDDVELLVRMIGQRLFTATRLAVNVSDLSPERADLLHWHQVWTEVADVRGWVYRREEWLS